MKYAGFSQKQKCAMNWWIPGGTYAGYEALICDGSVRSGKTLAMGLGFFLWAQCSFHGRKFALCGKTIAAFRRNVLSEILPEMGELGAKWKEKRSENMIRMNFAGHTNEYYIFGGRDEGSASLIQGMTLAGVLFDEVVLMPQSFVEQACARCSVTDSRLWFNCNPAGPSHWFYKQWIQQCEKRACLHLHFTMEDNPSLSHAIINRYQRLYSGVFYRRFVLGEWAQAEGRVYDFFEPDMAQPVPDGTFEKWFVSCDYGTVNPTSMGLWGLQNGIWYRVSEFYFASRREMRQMTDGEYASALENLVGDRSVTAIIVDPSAASFIRLLRQKGWTVRQAKNDVLSGIRATAELLKGGQIVICDTCRDCLREMEEYVWDLKSGNKDAVKKEHDHAMDDMRYFVTTALGKHQNGFAVAGARRRS